MGGDNKSKFGILIHITTQNSNIVLHIVSIVAVDISVKMCSLIVSLFFNFTI